MATAELCILVNDVERSAMGERARALAARAGRAGVIVYREGGKLAAMRAMLKAALRSRAGLIYVMDAGASGVVAGVLAAKWSSAKLAVDTGDAIHALAKAMGRSRLGCWATWGLEQLAVRTPDVLVVRGRGHVPLVERKARRVVWIPDGCVVRDFAPPADMEPFAGGSRALRVGVLGSCTLNPRTGRCYGWELVEALGLLRDVPVSGVLIGDGSGVPVLQRRCAELGVADRMEFRGRISYAELPRHLWGCDIWLSTQTNDAPGQVRTTGKLPLYMAAGRFVIATRVGEASRVLPEPMLLDFAGADDASYPGKLAARIREVIAEPRLLELGAANVSVAQSLFDYDRLGVRFRGVMDELLDRRATQI